MMFILKTQIWNQYMQDIKYIWMKELDKFQFYVFLSKLRFKKAQNWFYS